MRFLNILTIAVSVFLISFSPVASLCAEKKPEPASAVHPFYQSMADIFNQTGEESCFSKQYPETPDVPDPDLDIIDASAYFTTHYDNIDMHVNFKVDGMFSRGSIEKPVALHLFFIEISDTEKEECIYWSLPASSSNDTKNIDLMLYPKYAIRNKIHEFCKNRVNTGSLIFLPESDNEKLTEESAMCVALPQADITGGSFQGVMNTEILEGFTKENTRVRIFSFINKSLDLFDPVLIDTSELLIPENK